MSKAADYEAKTEALLKPIAEKHDIEIYDVEYVKEGSDYILRAYIDKEGGVCLNDCETVSRALSNLLDENDFIAKAYVLEVSSPGLERQLKKDKHLQKSIGAEVLIKTFKPIEGQPKGTKNVTGQLKRFDAEKVVLEIEGAEATFNRLDIAMMRLKFEF